MPVAVNVMFCGNGVNKIYNKNKIRMKKSITFERVTRQNADNFNWAYELLCESFPANERRTLKAQKEILEHPDYRLCVAMCGNVKVGVVGYFETPSFIYFENFCTAPQLRNSGFGSEILKALVAKYADRLFVLEAELPVDELTTRRIGFYKRNGMQVNVFDHIQPHYNKGDADLHLLVLSYGRQLTREEYTAFRKYLDSNVDVR